MHTRQIRQIDITLPQPLKSNVKDCILRKMASEQITYEVVEKQFEDGGENGIVQILTE